MLDKQNSVDNQTSNEKSFLKRTNSKWIDNDDNAVDNVFGFNKNAELVYSRAAMLGFLLLVLTELIFNGQPATMAIFGIN